MQNNTTNSSSIQADLPILANIPNQLKLFPDWVTFEYQVINEGIEAVATCEPTNLQEAYEAAFEAEALTGIAFKLTESRPIVCVELADCINQETETFKSWAADIYHQLESYSELINPYCLRIFIISHHATNIRLDNDHIRIQATDQIIPITGDRYGNYTDVVSREAELSALASQYSRRTWLEIAQDASNGDSDIKHGLRVALEQCLNQEDFLDEKQATDALPFLSACWGSPELREMIHSRVEDGTFWSRERRQNFYKAIEAGAPKAEKKPAKVATSEQDGDTTEDGRPQILADPTQIRQVVDDLEKILINNQAPFYQRDGSIVTIKYAPRAPQHGLKKDVARHRIALAKTKHIQEVATDLALWGVPTSYSQKTGKQAYKPGTCPENIVKHLEDRASSRFSVLTGITPVPTIRHDGSVITEPGYDSETGLYYMPSREYPEMSSHVSKDIAKSSLDRLLDVFFDFPFASDCHKSAAISAILSIIARHLMRTVPMFSSTSNTAGSGKGLMVEAISMIATGATPAFAANSDPEEMRKTLLAIAMEGDTITVFDNVVGRFGCPALDIAITTDTIKGRILGKSENATTPIHTVFFLTGNNIRYQGDLTRRLIPLTLAPKDQNPENRNHFRHNPLIPYLDKHHVPLLFDAINVLRAYILAGRPDQNLPMYGSFYDWSDLVRSALVWLGCADPCEGINDLQIFADDALEDIRTLIRAWHECCPNGERYQMRDIVQIVQNEQENMAKGIQYSRKWLEFGKALAEFDPRANKRVSELNQRRLSQRLPVNNGLSRVIDGLRIVAEPDRKSVLQWWIEPVGDQPATTDSEYNDAELAYDDSEWDFPTP